MEAMKEKVGNVEDAVRRCSKPFTGVLMRKKAILEGIMSGSRTNQRHYFTEQWGKDRIWGKLFQSSGVHMENTSWDHNFISRQKTNFRVVAVWVTCHLSTKLGISARKRAC